MGKNKKLHFETYEEAGDWFDTNDMSDYQDPKHFPLLP